MADGTFGYVDLPAVFSLLDRKVLGENLTVVTLILIACAAVCWLLLSRLRWGRYFYATGGNEEAARLSGIPVRGVKLLAYGLCGVLAAVAGICQAVQEQQGDPEAGGGYELSAIAIVVIGGNSLLGGRGGIGYTLLGALTIGYLEKILSMNAVGEASRLMLTGGIIVIAVLLQKARGTQAT
jgi:ribose transport system permease protein